jgi:hypothetical protein
MEALPRETAAAVRGYRGQRGPQKSPTKELTSLRIDRDVVAAYRATGAGWQTPANGGAPGVRAHRPSREVPSERPLDRLTATWDQDWDHREG